MQGIRWSISLVLVTVLCHTALSLPSIRIKRDDEQAFNEPSADLNPVESEDFANNEDIGREKRKLPEAAFGAKNAVIGFVFSGSKAAAGASAQASRPRRDKDYNRYDDTPDFERTNVSVDIPDQLFSSSFKTVTNLSQIFGNFMLNSARRYGRFVRLFKPLLGKYLIVKGYNPPPKTTTTTTTTTESSDIKSR